MKRILIFLAVAGAVAAARADLVMQQQITVTTNNSVTMMKVKGTKVRRDLYVGQPQAISTIMDLNTGDTIILLHNQKMFVKTTGAPKKQSKSPDSGARAGTAPKPRATGKTEKVGGYDTEIYTWTNARSIAGTAWVARDFPNFAKIRTDLAVLDKSPAGLNDDMSPQLSTLPGMVVKLRVAGSSQTITETLLSARDEAIDASLFGLPAGYREMPRSKPLTRPPTKTAPGTK